MKRSHTSRTWFTPPELAAETGVRAETVIGWIRGGELAAVDFARRGAARPRFRVRKDDFETFLSRRVVIPPAGVVRPRRAPSDLTTYV